MAVSSLPQVEQPEPIGVNEAILVASGDLRLAANQTCWAAQADMERRIVAAFAGEGITVRRGHPYDPNEKHGFISSQRMGMDVFKNIHPDAKLIVAEAVWQYSHHVLAGLRDHRGPILTVANWSGEWPGLVGMLNLNGSMTKAGLNYSTIWSLDFTDDFFLNGIRQWIREGKITHDTSHVRDLDRDEAAGRRARTRARAGAAAQARESHPRRVRRGLHGHVQRHHRRRTAQPDGHLQRAAEPVGAGGRDAARQRVTRRRAVRDWLDARGVKFITGDDEATELTDRQILEQCKMYIAAVRIAHDFGCAAIGIQYQQGLKDMAPASDLAEGLAEQRRAPAGLSMPQTGAELYAGQALPHFNEVDECAAVDAVVTNRIWTALGFDPATTLHDLRWGEHYSGDGVDDFVWVFEISGAAPASHFIGGYAGAISERQPPMYFRLGGGSLKGISKPGEIVWSRIFVMNGVLHADLGRATVVELPLEETERRWQATTPQWPIMHAVLHGVSRDQMMARHKANHLNVVYAPTAQDADRALAVKAAMLSALGVEVHLCGDTAI